MKSRLATDMDLGGRILVSTVLAVVVMATAGAQSAPTVSSAEARKAIQAGYVEWAKARVAMDKNTIERAGCTGWLEKIERQPMDPPILRATGPATVEG